MQPLLQHSSLDETGGQATIITGNIQGLYPRKGKHKVDLLKEMAIENETVILALTESHLRSEIKDAEVHIDGFQLFRADRTEGSARGGVVVYVKESSFGEVSVLSSGSNGVVEWIALKLGKPCIIFTFTFN